MATKFIKGQVVKVQSAVPQGPVQGLRMTEDGDFLMTEDGNNLSIEF